MDDILNEISSNSEESEDQSSNSSDEKSQSSDNDQDITGIDTTAKTTPLN